MNSQTLIVSPAEARRMETAYRIIRRSVDARQRELKVNVTLLVDEQGSFVPVDAPIPLYDEPVFQQVTVSSPVVEIVGAGPAGLFAALTLLQHGVKPIIYERGKDVSERKKDIALLNRNQGLNPESNYCFGEGGAGTFSDGKLFSRSKKRGDMQRVMELFHFFGAADTVLYETHAHIGSDKLPSIIRRMRECILAHGGEIRFGERWTMHNAQCTIPTTILAIGHSAHDTYRELANAGVMIEAKGCAMGVRIEHPQHLINEIFYHLPSSTSFPSREGRDGSSLVDLVGNAAYSLVTQVQGRGVYSFCMCPGGIIVPAGSAPESCVVNGMSASRRNSPFANSGMVVELHPEDRMHDAQCTMHDGLAWLEWQEQLEHTAWLQTHSTQAPAQRMRDFVEGKASTTLPPCSYLPGIVPSRLDQWLPEPIRSGLQQGFRDFDRKYRGFLTNEAVILGVESRSSSPVRIVRDPMTMHSLSHPWLYPCGEGAGYAGGITSSALDGMRAAEAICRQLNR